MISPALRLLCLLAVISVSHNAWCAAAASSASELTPLGAQQQGNAAGTIPPWTGGLTQAPENHNPNRHEVDPFPEDQPKFVITAANAEEYSDYLTAGQRALLNNYPDTWRLPVFATRRTAAFPEHVYEALKSNVSSAEAITEGRGGVRGAAITSPFPQPRNGLEAIWNHNLRWRGVRVQRSEGTAAVTRAGRFTLVVGEQDWAFAYGFRSNSDFKKRYPNLLLAVKGKTIEPDFLSGNGVLFFETINQTDDPRKTWNYIRALRRIIRAPYTGYELPAANTDGLRTVDDFGLFNGSPDRYNWRLVGKREIYIPYNAYRVHSGNLRAADIVRPGHINPEHLRYELHRVWEVEALLKPDAEHIYSKRVFYLDEDSWQIAVAESYDMDGELWRVNEAHALNYYTVPVLWSTLEVFHDLKNRRVLVNGLDNGRGPHRFLNTGDPREFSPNALIYYLR